MRSAVHSLKYRDLRALAPILGQLMADDPRVGTMRLDVLLPVPMHRNRHRHRGYNQAELLARQIGRRLNVPVDISSLRRVLDTPPQARSTSEKERETRLRDAFAASQTVAGLRVLLVDDVATTGSTLRECAAALKAAGAAEVLALVLAREV